MNQLATMLDTDLGIDPRVRSSRSAGETETGTDFGQVLQGLAKTEEGTGSIVDAGESPRTHKKIKTDGLLESAPDAQMAASMPVVTKTVDPADKFPKTAAGVPVVENTAAATNTDAAANTDVAANMATAGNMGTAANTGAATKAVPAFAGIGAAESSAAAAGRPAQLALSRGADATRTELSTTDAKQQPAPSALVEAVESGGRAKPKGASGLGTPGGFIMAGAAPATPSAGEPVRLAATQQKLLASLESKGLDTRSTGVAMVDPNAWSIGSLTRDDSSAALLQPLTTESTLTSPMGSEAWQADLGNQLVAMIENGDQSAVINLSPAELGPVQIDVAVHEGEVSVAFAAQVADTRAAIEASLPKLKEMLAGEGLSLTNSNINNMLSGFSQQRTPSRGGEDRLSQRGRFAEPEATVLVQTAPTRIRRSLVDLYA
ncbi:MAG: flagellar hook-length control protein FliK [Gammaproteobacteria bacterium]|nr:flagellar hook-length control protein FliK [Gammaproteobacteria bacterium]